MVVCEQAQTLCALRLHNPYPKHQDPSSRLGLLNAPYRSAAECPSAKHCKEKQQRQADNNLDVQQYLQFLFVMSNQNRI